jgi:hypothetical protein
MDSSSYGCTRGTCRGLNHCVLATTLRGVGGVTWDAHRTPSNLAALCCPHNSRSLGPQLADPLQWRSLDDLQQQPSPDRR